jgi:hypothetical protein
MRKSVLAATVAVLALVVAGGAIAFTQHSNISFTTTKAGHSTGIKADVFSTVTTGEQYRQAKRLVVTFPTGTKWNFGVVKACSLSDAQWAAGKTCPGSKVGTGRARVYVAGNYVNASVAAYVAGAGKMVIVATASLGAGLPPQRFILHERVIGTKLIIPIPTKKLNGLDVFLVKLTLNVPPRGSGRHALITAGKCTAGKFVIKSHFEYSSGPPIDLVGGSSCTS